MGAALSIPHESGEYHINEFGRSSGFLLPEHYERESAPLIPFGDPFNARNIVHDSDFHTIGKPWGYSWKHVNIFTNIRGINSIQEKYFGRIVSKIRYSQPPRTVQGVQQSFKQNVNLERPASMPFGDFATYLADGSERIGGRTGWR